VAALGVRHKFVESNHFNNRYHVPAAQRLWVYWYGIRAPESVAGVVEYDLDVYATSGAAIRHIADWHIGQDIEWRSCVDDAVCLHFYEDNEYDTSWFDIFGDENLELNVNISHPGSLTESLESVTVFGAESNWGSHPLHNLSCNPYHGDHSGLHRVVLGTSAGNAWAISYNICREETE